MMYAKVVTALSFASFRMVLSFLPVYTIAVISKITYFHYLLMLFTGKGRGYGRVRLMAITVSARKCILWYVAMKRGLTFLEFVLFY